MGWHGTGCDEWIERAGVVGRQVSDRRSHVRNTSREVGGAGGGAQNGGARASSEGKKPRLRTLVGSEEA